MSLQILDIFNSTASSSADYPIHPYGRACLLGTNSTGQYYVLYIIFIVSVICYVLLYFMIHSNSAGDLSSVLEVMTIIIIPAQIIHGVLLFMGALEGIVLPLQIALWLCLLLASYNTVLGVMGFIFYIRTGSLTMHFLLAVLFLLLAMTLFTALCHDILIIYAYKKMLSDDDEFDETPSALTYKESAVV